MPKQTSQAVSGHHASAPKHVQLLNEQVHIDDVGDFDCKQVSIDQCSLVRDYKHPAIGIAIGIISILLGSLMFWQTSVHTHSIAWAPLFLIAVGIYLLWHAIGHTKRYRLKLHTEDASDVTCETSIEEMDELKTHVKIKCQC